MSFLNPVERVGKNGTFTQFEGTVLNKEVIVSVTQSKDNIKIFDKEKGYDEVFTWGKLLPNKGSKGQDVYIFSFPDNEETKFFAHLLEGNKGPYFLISGDSIPKTTPAPKKTQEKKPYAKGSSYASKGAPRKQYGAR